MMDFFQNIFAHLINGFFDAFVMVIYYPASFAIGIISIGMLAILIAIFYGTLETAGTILVSLLFIETGWSLYSIVVETIFNLWPGALIACTPTCHQGPAIWEYRGLILDISYKIFASLGLGLIWLFLDKDKMNAFWAALIAQCCFLIASACLIYITPSGPNN